MGGRHPPGLGLIGRNANVKNVNKMPDIANLESDPDRWVNPQAAGAHEWWYFDAISDDGRDALVMVWYAALPFDPDYGLASLRHIRQPDRFPRPDPLEHCAVGFSWYRDGKTVAYALNRFNQSHFSHDLTDKSLKLDVHSNRLTRDPSGFYKLSMQTPALTYGPVPAKSIQAEIEFRNIGPVEGWEKDLGSGQHPHLWILAAPDCQVSGEISVGKQSLKFRGRGYHDHNAGDDELSRSFHRWHWGRFHHEETTRIYYVAEPQPGQSEGLWLTCRNGQVVETSSFERLEGQGPKRTVFGIRYQNELSHPPEELAWRLGKPVDQGPFYLRWVGQSDTKGPGHGRGICELLQADKLHQPWFNWMIPYRLKQPLGKR